MDIISAIYEFFYPSPQDDVENAGATQESDSGWSLDRAVKIRLLKRGMVALFFSAGVLIAWYALRGIRSLSDISPLRLEIFLLCALLMYFSSLLLVYFDTGVWRIVHPSLQKVFDGLRQGRGQPLLDLVILLIVDALIIVMLLIEYALHPTHEVTDIDPSAALSFLFVMAFILFITIVVGRYLETTWQRIGLVTGLLIAIFAVVLSGADYVKAILLSAIILLTARFISIKYLHKYG